MVAKVSWWEKRDGEGRTQLYNFAVEGRTRSVKYYFAEGGKITSDVRKLLYKPGALKPEVQEYLSLAHDAEESGYLADDEHDAEESRLPYRR